MMRDGTWVLVWNRLEVRKRALPALEHDDAVQGDTLLRWFWYTDEAVHSTTDH